MFRFGLSTDMSLALGGFFYFILFYLEWFVSTDFLVFF